MLRIGSYHRILGRTKGNVNNPCSRQIHTRDSPYKGWWTLILETSPGTGNAHEQRQEQLPAVVDLEEPSRKLPPPVPGEETSQSKNIVLLKGEPIELPQKPESPENCCMSGCVHCVWDLYQEDMEDYHEKKKALRKRFQDAGEPIPAILQSRKSVKEDVEEDMDPGMKAFLEMERKLKS
ncbi:oxidoreductase-like protein [Radiomyces spectabilis]|uniref:oxidoreductase-like protein n=1 Tax=Radiomyces spectabilis TaxID=64574 RepID=UPI0022203D52|nr:oxidoreductase-like protein [Radiomyces spectabilis]KAI8365914.1 oxidoreductase-like protein [Radiomyces spectabilis]